MSNNPIISIVMPSYNHESYIGEAIESLLGQTFHDFELIIVDDGSSDDSPEIIKKYAMQDARIIPLFQENQGPSAAMNRGLKIARGQFISGHPSDDKSCLNRFETLVKYLNEHPECDVVGSYIEEIDSQGKSVQENTRFASWFSVECDLSNPAAWVWSNRIASPTLLFRCDFFKRFGEYDPHLIYTQDWEMSIRSIAQGAIFQIIPSELFQYRSHANNLTNKNECEVFREYAYISAKRLIPWLTTKNEHEEIFKCVRGFVSSTVFKSFSKQERENLCLLLVAGFTSSYPDFCNVLADSTDKTILAEQNSINILSKLFVRYISELSEANAWLDSQRAAWENTATDRERYNASLESQNASLESQNASLESQNALLESQRVAWENTAMERYTVINQIYASHSWKLTRPLRFVMRLIREPKLLFTFFS